MGRSPPASFSSVVRFSLFSSSSSWDRKTERGAGVLITIGITLDLDTVWVDTAKGEDKFTEEREEEEEDTFSVPFFLVVSVTVETVEEKEECAAKVEEKVFGIPTLPEVVVFELVEDESVLPTAVAVDEAEVDGDGEEVNVWLGVLVVVLVVTGTGTESITVDLMDAFTVLLFTFNVCKNKAPTSSNVAILQAVSGASRKSVVGGSHWDVPLVRW